MVGCASLWVIVVAAALPADVALAAAADGYRRLVEVVLRSPTGDRTVSDAMADDPEADLALRRAVYAVREIHPAQYFADGQCLVGVSVRVSDLRERVADDPRLAEVVAGLPGMVLAATGVAAPPPKPPKEPRSTPAGWEGIPPEGVELAVEAAREDCREQLVNRIGELSLPSKRRVRAILADPPGLERGLAKLLENVKFDEPEYEPIQVCSVRGTMAIPDVGAALEQLARQHPSVQALAAADFGQLAESNRGKSVTAVGYGVPPAQYVRPSPRAGSGIAAPAWAKQSLRATGRGSQPPSKRGTAQGKLIAAAAAAADARMKLGERIDHLALPPDDRQTVKEFLLDHPELNRDVAAFIRGMRKVDTSWAPSGDATVVMEIDLRPLWSVLEPRLGVPRPKPHSDTQPSAGDRPRPAQSPPD